MPLDILSPLPRFSGLDQNNKLVDAFDYSQGKWLIIFTYPADFTPVCSTEMVSFSKSQVEFEKRNSRLLGCSRDSVSSHARWLKDIKTISGIPVNFPVIADEDGEIVEKLRCVVPGHRSGSNEKRQKLDMVTRSLYIVDPNHTIQYVQVMPQNTGRDLSEILRVLDSVQLSTLREVVATPADWRAGHDVVLLPDAKESDVQLKLENAVNKSTRFPYLRFVQLEQEKVS